MESKDLTVQQIFQDRRQYMVPFYQRTYVWTRQDQWQQLWDDIKAKAEDRLLGGGSYVPHFLGAVVLDPQPRIGLIGVDTLHIIDGQQRLTTLQFILKAVLIAVKAQEVPGIKQIITSVLVNGNPDTMRNPEIERYKVWPTFRDRDDYRVAIDAESWDELRRAFPDSFTQRQSLRRIGVQHPPALEAIWYFSEVFDEWLGDEEGPSVATRAEALAIAILQDFKVVSIVLGQSDDAQVIFETLNGRGAQLHATDLIRNFIFMRADLEDVPSEELYNRLWTRFEDDYWTGELRRGRMRKPRLEWFVHGTLQAELGEEIDLGRLYYEYRRFVFSTNPARTAESQLHTLNGFAGHYRSLIDGDVTTPVGQFGLRIAPFEVTTVHPLALLIANSGLAVEGQSTMFRYLASFIVRRAICGLTAKNYNNIFLGLLRQLSSRDVTPDSLRAGLIGFKGEATRWPSDDEFRNACLRGTLYPGSLDVKATRAVLTEIEFHLRGEARSEDSFGSDYTNLDIDHIMPQSWFKHWPLRDFGYVDESEVGPAELRRISGHELSDRDQALLNRRGCIPRLGNLTLLNLSVNREAQAKSFEEKRRLLIANTNLRLNVPLVAIESWDEISIMERGGEFATAALTIWPGP
jgi:uncharacterized protein DUF262/uncharacterized protein DUF1524